MEWLQTQRRDDEGETDIASCASVACCGLSSSISGISSRSSKGTLPADHAPEAMLQLYHFERSWMPVAQIHTNCKVRFYDGREHNRNAALRRRFESGDLVWNTSDRQTRNVFAQFFDLVSIQIEGRDQRLGGRDNRKIFGTRTRRGQVEFRTCLWHTCFREDEISRPDMPETNGLTRTCGNLLRTYC